MILTKLVNGTPHSIDIPFPSQSLQLHIHELVAQEARKPTSMSISRPYLHFRASVNISKNQYKGQYGLAIQFTPELHPQGYSFRAGVLSVRCEISGSDSKWLFPLSNSKQGGDPQQILRRNSENIYEIGTRRGIARGKSTTWTAVSF